MGHRCDHVLVADDDERRGVRERGQRRVTGVRVQRTQVAGDGVDRGARVHLLHIGHQRRRRPVGAEPVPPGQQPRQVGRGAAGPVDGRPGHPGGVVDDRQQRAADPADQRRQAELRLVDQPARGGDQRDTDDPLVEHLGVDLRERHDRHAAHRVADEDDRPVGHRLVEHRAQRLAERRQLVLAGLQLAGPAVAGLVVEDHAVVTAGAERLALEVERAHVEAEAVHEDDGRLVPGVAASARPPRRGCRCRRRS